MKTCNKCGIEKPLDDYYARHNACKECVKERVRANRRAKLEYYREYDRSRANKPKRIAAWLTHIFVCLSSEAWGFLIAGAIMFPIGIIHGYGLWFGFF